jgi:predicted Fe-Mo cluster-binding NifX family protein
MIVAAVKTNKENPPLNTVFGKSKWFAYIDGENISIEKNEFEGAGKVAKDILAKGVKSVICNHMAQKAYDMLKENGVEVYFSGEERILLDDAIKKLSSGELIKIDESNKDKYIKTSHGHHHH